MWWLPSHKRTFYFIVMNMWIILVVYSEYFFPIYKKTSVTTRWMISCKVYSNFVLRIAFQSIPISSFTSFRCIHNEIGGHFQNFLGQWSQFLKRLIRQFLLHSEFEHFFEITPSHFQRVLSPSLATSQDISSRLMFKC